MFSNKIYFLTFLTCSSCSQEIYQLKVDTEKSSFVEQDNNKQGSFRFLEQKCPQNMVHVEGDFCPNVKQNCKRWVDADNPNGPNMCAEFEFPTVCLSEDLVHMSFCVDKYEAPNVPGVLPEVNTTWVEAKASCEAQGKRLPTEDELTFACEGQSMKPYPYGDGYHRDDTACNAGRRWINPWENSFEDVDQREPTGTFDKCVSDFGVYDIVANADEWVINPKGFYTNAPYVSGLHGGHYVKGVRNRCRALTVSHSPTFSFYVTGYRCVKDVDQ